MPNNTGTDPEEHSDGSEPWRSWPTTVRYLVVRLAQATPSGVLVWLAYLHH
jgi:hypothetical protein